MAPPVDLLTSLISSPPPAADHRPRPQDARDQPDLRDQSIANDRSAFQRHLDDEQAENDVSRQTETMSDVYSSEDADDTHGETVSQVATTNEVSRSTKQATAATGETSSGIGTPDELDGSQNGKGEIVKVVASDKVEAGIETPEAGVTPVPAESAMSSGAQETETEAPTGSPTPATDPTSSGPSSELPSPEVIVTTDNSAASSSGDEMALDAVTTGDEPQTISPSSTPPYNENAQKVDGSERPGWGADDAPRSERGTQARNLKSENASITSTDKIGRESQATSGNTPEVTDQEGSVVTQALESSAASGDDTGDAEAVASVNITDTSEPVPTPSDPTLMATPVQEEGSSDDTDIIGAIHPAAVSTELASGSDTPKGADKSPASPPGTDQPARSQATFDLRTAASAETNPAPNASPTGVAKALASGQGAMPMAGTPSGEEVETALAGIDKRGNKSGTSLGEMVSASKSKSQAAVNQAGQKSNSSFSGQGNQNQAAAAASALGAQGAQPTQTGQMSMTPTMPDPVSLMNIADPGLSGASSTMEVDPATGALHLAGTGSAKMSAPNLSQVTLQFTRARMFQTPAKDIAVQIAKHVSNGINRFDIRITPPELGRIEVKMTIADSGKVTAHLVADKPETLELLQKDRSTLEKALAEAGLDTDSSSLDFSMREGGDKNDGDFSNPGLEIADEASDGQNTVHIDGIAELEVSAYGFDIVRMKRLDISI